MDYQENLYIQPDAQPAFVPEPDPVQVEFENEKRDLRKRCNGIGLMVLISSTAFLFVTLVLMVAYEIFKGNLTLPANLDSIPDNIINSFANAAVFGIFALICIKVTKAKTTDVLVFEKVSFKKLSALVVAGFSVFMVSNLLTNLYLTNMYNLGIDLMLDIETPVSNSFLEMLVYFVSTAVVPAFSEEILFRGVILSHLRKHGDGLAVFVSALLFGLFHANFIQIPFAFIGGLALGFTVVYTNSMLPAILIHLFNNGYSVISDILYTNADAIGLSETILDIFTYIFVAAVSVVGLIAVIVLSRKDKNFLKLRKYEGVLDNKTRTKMFVTSPTVIIASVYLILESIYTHVAVALM